MSRSLGTRKSDGLDLLLDTICNTFGSIILIALLIVLISSDQPEQETPSAQQSVGKDEIQRRIRTAEADIAKLRAALPESAADPGLAGSIRDLESKIAEGKQALERAKQEGRDRKENASADFSTAAADSAAERRRIEEEIARVQNALATSKARIAELEKYSTTLTMKIDQSVQNKTERLRLPTEHKTEKKPSNVIFSFNEIFPVGMPVGSEWKLNDAITRVPVREGSNLLKPNRGEGIRSSTDSPIIREILRRTPQNEFFACYVFPDSIEAFRAFRKQVQNAGFELGWEPILDTKDLIFSSEGTSPDPQ